MNWRDRAGFEAQNERVFIPAKAGREEMYRCQRYVAWLDAEGRSWTRPDLAAYRDYLANEKHLALRTIISHLSTIRRRYRDLVQDDVFAELVKNLPEHDRDRLKLTILEALDPAAAKVGADYSRRAEFTVVEYRDFLQAVRSNRSDNLMGDRDVALIELMLMTGLRENEVMRIKVSDLNYTLGMQPALRIEQTRGSKVRLAPYLEGEIPISVLSWIKHAKLGKGDWLFRTFYRGGYAMRSNHMQLPAVRQVLARYPQWASPEGDIVLTSTDMRATYAWHMHHEKEERVEAIAQYLGASVEMVEYFLGDCQSSSTSHDEYDSLDSDRTHL